MLFFLLTDVVSQKVPMTYIYMFGSAEAMSDVRDQVDVITILFFLRLMILRATQKSTLAVFAINGLLVIYSNTMVMTTIMYARSN